MDTYYYMALQLANGSASLAFSTVLKNQHPIEWMLSHQADAYKKAVITFWSEIPQGLGAELYKQITEIADESADCPKHMWEYITAVHADSSTPINVPFVLEDMPMDEYEQAIAQTSSKVDLE